MENNHMRCIILLLPLILFGCEKPNGKPTYGETGLPKNCRAIIQSNLDEYRKIRATHDDYEIQLMKIDDVFNSLGRNCGAYGYSWEYK